MRGYGRGGFVSICPFPSPRPAVYFSVLTNLCTVCAGSLIYDTVQQVIQPHAGHHLQLVTLDLGPCHTWAQNNHQPESGTSATFTAQAQVPKEARSRSTRPRNHRELSRAALRALRNPRHPTYGSSAEPRMYSADHQLSNHDKWVEQKLAEGQRFA